MTKTILISIICIVALASCGPTILLVDNNSEAEIYVNNKFLGKGHAEMKRNGRPKKVNIETKYNSEITGTYYTKRRFTIATAVVGLYTYGLGLIFFWQFPEEIHLPCNVSYNKEKNNSKSPWDYPPNKRNSIWDK